MSLFRYLTAFTLSLVTFLLLGYLFKTLLDKPTLLQNLPSKVIKIALINPVKKTPEKKKVSTPAPILPTMIKSSIKKTTKPVVKKVPKPVLKRVIKKVVKKSTKKVIKKPKHKPKKKPIVHKKKPKHKPKKHVKKIVKRPVQRVVKQPKYVPPVIETVVQETYYRPAPVQQRVVAPAPVVRATTKVVKQPKIKPVTARPAGDNGRAKKAFLRNVRSKIIANKKYPKMALRRHVEGSVKIRFDIDANGYVSNIRFINGKSIFHKSIRKTLERTFPVGIPPAMRGKLPISDVSVVLHFNIR